VGNARGTDAHVNTPFDLTIFTQRQFPRYATHLTIGAAFGAFLGNSLSNRCGRKKALAVTAFVHIISWAMISLVRAFMSMVIWRLVAGIAVGMGSFVAPCYIREVVPPHLKRPLASLDQLSIVFGALLANVFGSFVFVEEYDGHMFCDWRSLSRLGVLLSVLLLWIVCMPESPRWLASKGQLRAARFALRRLRTGSDGLMEEESELTALAEMAVAGTSDQASVGNNRRRLREFRGPFGLTLGLVALQQLSGISAVLMYATEICSRMGLREAELGATSLMAAQLLFTGAAGHIADLVSRRSLLQLASAAAFVGHLGISYHYLAREQHLWAPEWLAPASLLVYILASATGLGPLPWLMLAESLPEDVMGRANATAAAVGWSCAFLVCGYFWDVQEALSPPGVFLLFAFVCFCCFLYVTLLVPESRGKAREPLVAGGGGARAGAGGAA